MYFSTATPATLATGVATDENAKSRNGTTYMGLLSQSCRKVVATVERGNNTKQLAEKKPKKELSQRNLRCKYMEKLDSEKPSFPHDLLKCGKLNGISFLRQKYLRHLRQCDTGDNTRENAILKLRHLVHNLRQLCDTASIQGSWRFTK